MYKFYMGIVSTVIIYVYVFLANDLYDLSLFTFSFIVIF
jgi:hypothetical protein